MLAFLLVLLYLILFFCVVLVSALAEKKRIIEDKEFPISIGIFVPPAVLVFLGALWLADYINHKR